MEGQAELCDPILNSLMKLGRFTAPVLLAICAYAQSAPTTTLSGTVVDSSGGVVPAASLELTNQATHWTHKTTSDAQGRFQFSLVPPAG